MSETSMAIEQKLFCCQLSGN